MYRSGIRVREGAAASSSALPWISMVRGKLIAGVVSRLLNEWLRQLLAKFMPSSVQP